MANRLTAFAHLATQVSRAGYYTGIRQLTERIVARLDGTPSSVKVTQSVPKTQRLLRDFLKLLRKDSELVKRDIYPASINTYAPIVQHVQRMRKMLEDLPTAHKRRVESDGKQIINDTLPDYYVQNFHYQTGGYLTEESAELYDLQVETLFMGSAEAMRRQALFPISDYLYGKDQRKVSVLDIACGTGRFIKDLRRSYPRLPITGLDLSQAYIEEAQKYLAKKHFIKFITANAEQVPLPDNSQDIVTCIFMYHELPPEIRRKVTTEIARILKPEGIFVFIDSLQLDDNPDYNGMLEAFPQRFHEPFYRGYLIDNLEEMFSEQGLPLQTKWNAFLSKIIVCKKIP